MVWLFFYQNKLIVSFGFTKTVKWGVNLKWYNIVFYLCSLQEVPFYLDDFLIPDSTDFLQDLYVIGLQESKSMR